MGDDKHTIIIFHTFIPKVILIYITVPEIMEYMNSVSILILMMQRTINSYSHKQFKLSPVTEEGFDLPKISDRSLTHLAVECASMSSCEGFVKFSDDTIRIVLSIQDQTDVLMDGFQLQPQFDKINQHWIIQRPLEAYPGIVTSFD